MGNGCLGKGAAENPEEKARGQDFSSTVTFIDVLFAVVMGLGLTQIIELCWFKSLSFESVFGSAFEIAVISLGYLTLFCSWWGYHRSVRRRQLPGGTIGVAIFGVDILLLACYWLLLVKFESLLFVLSFLFVVFSLYVIWDTLWWLKERPERVPATRQRRAVTIFWMLGLGVILGAYVALGRSENLSTELEWGFVLVAYLVLILYRVHKERLFLRRFLDILVLKFRYEEAN